MAEVIFMKLGIYIRAPEPISMAYFMNPPISLCVYMYIHPIVARQQLSKCVTAATNTHTTVEELLYASFSVLSVLYHRKVGD
jgi:hypothetical protein